MELVPYKKVILTGLFDRCEVVNDCLQWTGKPARGYGTKTINSKSYTVHRLVLILTTGMDDKNLDACHKPIICHNRLCCNPDHLYWGTKSQNALDRKLDGTQVHTHQQGEAHSQAKLTEDQVRAIRLSTKNHQSIADEYGISKFTVRAIKRGRIWKHLLSE